MGRYVENKCKLCRREGMKLFLKGQRCFTDKCAVSRRDYPPGVHAQKRAKVTDYGVRVREKQKLKRIYGVWERQFKLYFQEAERMKGNTGEMLLQIMEEGRLTDSFGRNVDFRNGIVIMTSNLGADLIKGGGGFGFQKRTADVDYANIKGVLIKEIERFFRPEFINRLDDVIVFRPLIRDDLALIVEYEVAKVGKRLAAQSLTLELDAAAKEFLIEKGYNPEFGARPLRRSIGQYVEDPLSEMLLSKDVASGGKIMVTRRKNAEGVEDEHLFFDFVPTTQPPASGDKPATLGASST